MIRTVAALALCVASPAGSQEETRFPSENVAARPLDLACAEVPRLPSPSFASGDAPRDNGDVNGRKCGPLRFRVSISQVLVPVTVTDGSGRFVEGLEAKDFHVLDDRMEQRIELLMNEKTPLTLAVVVDVSGSMRSKMKDTSSALTELLTTLGTGDRAFVLGFNWWVVTLQELTGDRTLLAKALSGIEPRGGTALFDGILEGLHGLHELGPESRRALVVLSDGFDNMSASTPRESIAAAKAIGIPIYTVGLGEKLRQGFLRKLLGAPLDPEFEGIDEETLRALSESSGGASFLVSDVEHEAQRPNALADAFGRLARELRSHYVLSYPSPGGGRDGRWHSIRVELSRPDLFAKFRPGYLALPAESVP